MLFKSVYEGEALLESREPWPAGDACQSSRFLGPPPLITTAAAATSPTPTAVSRNQLRRLYTSG